MTSALVDDPAGAQRLLSSLSRAQMAQLAWRVANWATLWLRELLGADTLNSLHDMGPR